MKMKILSRLIWKDARSVAPFWAALCVGVIVLNLILWFVFQSGLHGGTVSEPLWLVFAMWVLLPNLFALGAPALLVGAEEESGSLAWLRTLPADWRSIVSSKLAVTVSLFVVLFVLSSVCMVVQRMSFPDGWNDQLAGWSSLSARDASEAAAQFAFGIILMMVSLIFSFLIRSPVSAIVMVGVAMAGLSWGWISATDYFTSRGYGTSPHVTYASDHPLVALVLVGIASAIVLACLFLVAWVRLVGPELRSIKEMDVQPSEVAFRPPATSRLSVTWSGRPQVLWALFWQSLRQNWLLLISGFIAVIAGLSMVKGEQLWAFAVLFGVFLISGITFYSDSVRSRATFFHDRGLSPTLFWLSRVAPSFAVLVSIVIVGSLVNDQISGGGWLVLLLGFGLTQLASAWAPRPILVFFLAPATVFLALMILMPLINWSRASEWSLVLSTAVTLFASWRLMPAFLKGERDRVFHLRFVGYTAAAVLLPYLLQFSYIWWMTPGTDLRWREATLALNVTSTEEDSLLISPGAFRSSFHNNPASVAFRLSTVSDTDLQAELKAFDSVASFVTFDQLLSYSHFFPGGMPREGYKAAESSSEEDSAKQVVKRWRQSDLLVAQVFANWSQRIRSAAVTQDISYPELVSSAEEADRVTLLMLDSYLKVDGPTDELRSIYQSLPSKALVQESRRNSLIRSWQEVQRNGSRHDPSWMIGSGTLPDRNSTAFLIPTQWWLGGERRRIFRQFDEFVRWQLIRWERGESIPTNFSNEELMHQLIYQSCGGLGIMTNDRLRKQLDQRFADAS